MRPRGRSCVIDLLVLPVCIAGQENKQKSPLYAITRPILKKGWEKGTVFMIRDVPEGHGCLILNNLLQKLDNSTVL